MRLLAITLSSAALTVMSLASPSALADPPTAMVGWFQQPLSGPSASGPPAPSALQGPTGWDGQPFEVVPLRYADVSEIAGLLTANQTVRPNDGFVPQEPNFGSSAPQSFYGSAAGFPGSPIASSPVGFGQQSDPLGRSIDTTIGIDRRLNAVIVHGSPSRIEAVKAQIAQLDIPVASVVLETEFVELSESGARNLGLDFSNANNQIIQGNYVYSHGFPGLSDTPRAGGITASFQAALYAQIARGEGRIVSKPRISAQSGGSAKIVTGDALPILTAIALSGVNAVQQQVQYVNVGVTLQIAPRVSADGFVTSHVFAVVSTVNGFSQGYPTITQREATTAATVRDGQPFVIGGLTQESDISNKSKLPLLGDVPLLGKPFNVEHRNKSRRDLYIVITPHIVHDPALSSPKPTPDVPH